MLPEKLKGGAAKAVVAKLVDRGLLEEIRVKRGEPHWRVEANEHPTGLKLTRWLERAAPGPRSGWRFPQRLTRLSSPEKGRADRDRFSLRQRRTKESPASEMLSPPLAAVPQDYTGGLEGYEDDKRNPAGGKPSGVPPGSRSAQGRTLMKRID